MTIPITFFDTRSIVHFEFIPQSQTFNQAYYVEISKRLREIVRRKMPELWPKGLILHYDSASAQKALSLKELSGQKTYYWNEPPLPPFPLCLRMTSGCFQK